MFSKIHPASTVTVFPSKSIFLILFNFVKLMRIEFPELSGVAPPQSPVLPPCGTIGILFLLASFNILLTSSVVDGNTTNLALPSNTPLQSLKYCSMPSIIIGFLRTD